MEKEKSINEEGITYAKAENQIYEVNCKKIGMLGAHRARGQSRKKMGAKSERVLAQNAVDFMFEFMVLNLGYMWQYI